LPTGAKKNADVVAVLVDGHDGDRKGMLLQHPVLQSLNAQKDYETIAKSLKLDDKQMESLESPEGLFKYEDPVCKHEFGKEYSGEWIASMRQVDISRRINREDDAERKISTNLYLMVQERSDAAVAPVSKLVVRLMREGWFALSWIVALIAALWYFVFRALRHPEQASIGARLRSSTEHLSTAANEATIDVG
jgi:hypothetical protein